jgi:hypothetical protein
MESDNPRSLGIPWPKTIAGTERPEESQPTPAQSKATPATTPNPNFHTFSIAFFLLPMAPFENA